WSWRSPTPAESRGIGKAGPDHAVDPAGCRSSARPRNSEGRKPVWEGPTVADVHRTREELAAQFDFDVTAIFADLRKRQAALGPCLVFPRTSTEPTDAVDGVPETTSKLNPGCGPVS